MDRAEILHEAIIGHRAVIEERYRYGRIIEEYDVPHTFTQERLDPISTFFLEYIYPDTDRRKEIDEAFASLDHHIDHPEHLGRIVMDSASLLFKFGRHLPKIFKAGLSALRSFRAAARIEGLIADKAIEVGERPPYTADAVKTLMSQLPPTALDELVDKGIVLFDVLVDRRLVDRIVRVISHLADKMRARPGVYAPEEIRGMELGQEIITQCMNAFYKFDKREQQDLISLIEEIERDAMEDIKKMNTSPDHI